MHQRVLQTENNLTKEMDVSKVTGQLGSLELDEFPTELLVLILSYVDPLTLAELPLVCKKWYVLLNSDMIWHEIFKIQYPKKSVFSTITRSRFYKTELLHRTNMKHEYKRGKLLNNTFEIRNLVGTHTLNMDWSRNKLISIDVENDRISSCEISSGKMSNEFYKYIPATYQIYDAGFSQTNVYGTRAIIYGSQDGTVSGTIVDWKGLLVSDVTKWGNMDDHFVTAVCVCINANPSSTKDYEKNVPSIASLTKPKPKKKVLVMNSNSGIKLGNLSTKALHTTLTKSGTIGAFSVNAEGKLWGWDIRTGEVLCKLQLPTFPPMNEAFDCIIKVLSDGKTAAVCIASCGDIWVIKNIFNMMKDEKCEATYHKIGQIPQRDPFTFWKNVFVDYGNESVIAWNDFELMVYSFKESVLKEDEYNCDVAIYTPPTDTNISLVSFEANATPFLKRDENIVGSDPLYAAIALTDGSVEIVNVRESAATLTPTLPNPIKPKFLKEFYKTNKYVISESMGPIAAIALSSMVLAVSNHEGKVEIFDLLSGEFLRIATDKLSNKRLAWVQFCQPQRIRNRLVQLSLDQNTPRGLVSVGPYIQYFTIGEGKRNEAKESERRKRNWKRIGKASYCDEVNFHLDNYETEVANKKKDKVLLNKYNGSHTLTEEEELLLVTSMSLETAPAEQDDEVDELERALKLSMLEGQQSLRQDDLLVGHSGDINFENNVEREFEEFDVDNANENEDEDEELRLALELSKRENFKNWDGDEYDDDFEDKWESLLE